MYDVIDFMAATAKVADDVIIRERTRYKPYYEIIVRLIAESKPDQRLILADTAAIDAFEARSIDVQLITREAAPLIVFCADPLEAGKRVMNAIGQGLTDVPGLSEMQLYPSMPGREYHITIPSRRLLTFRALGNYRDFPLTKIIRSPLVVVPGPAASLAGSPAVALMSPEILLIDLYRRIPLASDEVEKDLAHGEASEQQRLIRLERRLFDRFMSDFAKGQLTEQPTKGRGESTVPIKLVSKLRRLLLTEFDAHNETQSAGSMIVGRQAIDPDEELNGLQIVCTYDDNIIRARIEATLEIWKQDSEVKTDISKNGDVAFDIRHFFLAVPVDRRLRRFRLFLARSTRGGTEEVEGGKREEKDSRAERVQVLDIFTAANYDIIARHPYTLLRFIFVDIWTIVLMHGLGEVNEHSVRKILEKMVDLAKKAHKQTTAVQTSLSDPKNFFGTYVDELIAIRREKATAGKAETLFWAAGR